jgi:hypothetical protein
MRLRAAARSGSIRPVEHSSSVPGLEGLTVEAVEWLPSGSDAGLIRVRGRWTEPGRREPELPALGLRRGEDARRFESLPDARFGRDPTVWRATYLVPAALMDPDPDALWLSWESGAQAGLPAPARGFEPPATPAPPPVPDPGGEVIDRAVLAERRARRAEAAERTQAQRAAEALKAVEVLELRSAELERRLEALQSQALPAPESPASAAADPVAAAETGRAATGRPDLPARTEPAPAAEPSVPAPADPGAAGALTEAVAAVKRLRSELGEQRQRLRRSELLRAADAVALASFRDAAGRTRRLQEELAAREHELREALAAAEARAAEAAAAREQAAEQVAQAAQRGAADAAEVRRRAADELASARAEARAELDAAARDLALEQDAHAQTRERLAAREQELAAIAHELAGVRTELATVRQDAAERAAELERRLVGLETALAAERRAHGTTAAERETARAGLALAESARSAEAVARTALDDELDRERLARATLTEALDAAHAQLAAAGTTESELVRGREHAQADAAAARAELEAIREQAASAEASVRAELAAAREQAASAEASARDLRTVLDATRTELAAARARIAELEAELEAGRGALDSAGREAGGLMERIAELERAADDDLERRAREQAEAAAAVERPSGDAQRDVTASLDAAAAALRARPAAPAAAESAAAPPAAGEQEAKISAIDATAETIEQATPAPPAPGAEPAPGTPAPAPAEPAPAAEPVAPGVATPPPPAPRESPARPRILTESRHPARADIVGSSKRRYPWLRGALVKLAHDDPRAATRLVLGLVPVQRALVEPPLEYDLTIRGSGTYAISIGQQGAAARSVGGPRPRAEAAFHVAADIVTLTELLAGVEKRMGRWLGSVRLHGRRRAAEALRAALTRADLDLPAAARAGADLDPDLVFRAFAYAIHPAWTKGHRFIVAQEIAGPRPIRWHVVVRDGAPVSVHRRSPGGPPDAVVSMTPAAYSHVLRGEQAPSGERPTIRGDRAAVAVLKAWTDRAQGRAV